MRLQLAGILAGHALKLAGTKRGAGTIQSLMLLRSFDERCGRCCLRTAHVTCQAPWRPCVLDLAPVRVRSCPLPPPSLPLIMSPPVS